MDDSSPQRTFQLVKPVCVELLRDSLLVPRTIPVTSERLSTLLSILQDIPNKSEALEDNVIGYVFYPLSILIRRNPLPAIPDQLVEKIFTIYTILVERWWWDCELAIWDETFKLCTSLLRGTDHVTRPNGRKRDDETLEAAARCLFQLVRPRTEEEVPRNSAIVPHHDLRFKIISSYAQRPSFFPVIGEAVNTLLDHCKSQKQSLQLLSLHLVALLIEFYIPESRILLILPGVVGSTSEAAVGSRTKRGWQTGDVVKASLETLDLVIVKGIGDKVCIEDEAIRKPVVDLEDLVNVASPTPFRFDDPRLGSTSSSAATTPAPDLDPDPHVELRTPAWLNAASAQIHLAINNLSRLVGHPTPSAQLALAHFSTSILRHCALTLPTLHPLLLSHLLEFSLSPFPNIASDAENALVSLFSITRPDSTDSYLSPDKLTDILFHLTSQQLSALPRYILIHADVKVLHASNQVLAVCQLAHLHATVLSPNLRSGLARILGSNGGIEKWGTSLLAVTELRFPPSTVIAPPVVPVGLILDSFQSELDGRPMYSFPELMLKHVVDPEAQKAVEGMLRGLGQIAGLDGLFAVEWFVKKGSIGGRQEGREVAALWCATNILEGIGGVMPGSTTHWTAASRKRLEKVIRSIVKTISELWEAGPFSAQDATSADGKEETALNSSSKEVNDAFTLIDASLLPTEHITGVTPWLPNLDISRKPLTGSSFAPNYENVEAQAKQHSILHRTICLQLFNISASLLASRFPSLLLYVLYPLLRSLVSSSPLLSSAALASLHHITHATTVYASPSNLLLANFDYALDGVSSHLLPRSDTLDFKATRVLVVLVRLVGRDVVRRAGDLVTECFDRLDEFHGYSKVVEGLVAVLEEVVEVAEDDELDEGNVGDAEAEEAPPVSILDKLWDWFDRRNDAPLPEKEDFGPAPQVPWASLPADEGKGKGSTRDDAQKSVDEDPKLTPTQALVVQILSRSLPFLTHRSPQIRAHILTLLRSSVSKVPPKTLARPLHKAWPFILNRLSDSEPFVVVKTVELLGRLLEPHRAGGGTAVQMSSHFDSEVWPALKKMLTSLEQGERQHSLTAKKATPRPSSLTPPRLPISSYRLQLAILGTLASAYNPQNFVGAYPSMFVKEKTTWEVTLLCRRYLRSTATAAPRPTAPQGKIPPLAEGKEATRPTHAASELTPIEAVAVKLFQNLRTKNEDVVWLVLGSTCRGRCFGLEDEGVEWLEFLAEDEWEIEENVKRVFGEGPRPL